ncbi:unnamed protein product [Closterium sp. Naga37s-1]|nr:unnamed protein product [Closterium sp. Naga37s-1]
MGTDGRGGWASADNHDRRFDSAGGGEIGGGGGEFGGGFDDADGAAEGDEKAVARGGEAGGGDVKAEARGEGQAQGGASGGENAEDVGKEQAASGAYCAREASLHAEVGGRGREGGGRRLAL